MKNQELEVWIDTNVIATEPVMVGLLSHDRGSIRFKYIQEWLEHSNCLNIDPDLSLDNSVFHPTLENFGVFLDSSPDRWGQTLMKRREAMEARDAKRKPRTLYPWDYLVGVQDQTRQGALRFKYPGENVFLAAHQLSAPPVAQLKELEFIAKELSGKKIDDLDALKKWLRVLVAPGASLGGARPKANFTESDGSLWIAKFPAKDDARDVGAWEMLAYKLAVLAGINMPPAKLLKLSNEYRTFAVKRFDRQNRQRIHYASAMTMLKKGNSDDSSYLDIAQILMIRGARGSLREDLTQLFRRLILNIAICNRDDHLRNHGFVLTAQGWRLSPAFDINPNIDHAEHVLNLNENDNFPSIEIAIETAEYYELNKDEAVQIAKEILEITKSWEKIAKKLGIARAEIDLMRAAFL